MAQAYQGMQNKMYLVTGAAGFLGINICRNLLGKKEKVRALVLAGDKAAKHIPQGIEIIYGDVLDVDSLKKFFDLPKDQEIIVIHTASIVALSPDKNQKVYDVNVTGTLNIIDLCIEKKAKLVYISSTGAITELAKKQIISEPQKFEPEKLVGYYSQTKAMATMAVFNAVKNKNLNATVIYPSGICGPNDYASGPFVQFIRQYCNGEMKSGIEGSFNSVDVRDLAEGVVVACEKGRKGEGYIMSNCIVSMREIFDLISETTGAPRVEKIISVRMAKIVSFFAPKLLTRFQIYNLARNNNFDCSKAGAELGFKARPFKETMQDTAEWLKKEGMINGIRS